MYSYKDKIIQKCVTNTNIRAPYFGCDIILIVPGNPASICHTGVSGLALSIARLPGAGKTRAGAGNS